MMNPYSILVIYLPPYITLSLLICQVFLQLFLCFSKKNPLKFSEDCPVVTIVAIYRCQDYRRSIFDFPLQVQKSVYCYLFVTPN